MFLAIESPLIKTIVAGAVALTATAILARSHDNSAHRLTLHAPVAPNTLYLTAWEKGDVTLRYDHTPRKITLTQEAWVNDGCQWRAIETLVPIDDHNFRYSYEEEKIQCVEGANPCVKTPRTGIVTVDE